MLGSAASENNNDIHDAGSDEIGSVGCFCGPEKDDDDDARDEGTASDVFAGVGVE